VGPLTGVKVVEFEGIGPVPLAAMLLADLGADIIRVERGGHQDSWPVLDRGRPSLVLDLKSPEGAAFGRRLVDAADILLEGHRPGVMERLGLGPDACRAQHPELVYARTTGWGQDGPWAPRAGHDINYLALAGALHQFRRAGERPVPPMNLVADYGGGALYLVLGVLAALLHARATGEGQVLDVAMVDGVASLLAPLCSLVASGRWDGPPGTNFLDTGAPFYDVYETKDGQFVAVGALEPQFYSRLLDGMGLAADDLPAQYDEESWPAMKERFAATFRARTRDEWSEIFDGTDACVAPVLSVDEAARHPHLAARGTYVERHGILQPGVAPRFGATTADVAEAPDASGADAAPALHAWGFDDRDLAQLAAMSAITPGV
jgi:alpha-methylacyl-CoA racemase